MSHLLVSYLHLLRDVPCYRDVFIYVSMWQTYTKETILNRTIHYTTNTWVLCDSYLPAAAEVLSEIAPGFLLSSENCCPSSPKRTLAFVASWLKPRRMHLVLHPCSKTVSNTSMFTSHMLVSISNKPCDTS